MTKQKNLQPTTYNLQPNGGFVLAFSVLVAGILLAIGIALYGITLKELMLSSSGRESQFAFYAADTGGECALYWDIRHPGYALTVFPTSTDSTLIPEGSGVYCNGSDITDPASGWESSGWTVSGVDGDSATIELDMSFANGTCATVRVTKDVGNTRIDSRGYNTCDIDNPRRVERGLRITY